MRCYTISWGASERYPTLESGIQCEPVQVDGEVRQFAGTGDVWAECSPGIVTNGGVAEASVFLLPDNRPYLDETQAGVGFLVLLDLEASGPDGDVDLAGRREAQPTPFATAYRPWTYEARPLVTGVGDGAIPKKLALVVMKPGSALRITRKHGALYGGPPVETSWVMAEEDGLRLSTDEREIPSFSIRGFSARPLGSMS